MGMERSSTQPSIPCKVIVGMYRDERGIIVEPPVGKKIEVFANKREVVVNQDPEPGGVVDGRVIVSIVEIGEKSVLIDLPQPGINVGTRHWVPKSMLE